MPYAPGILCSAYLCSRHGFFSPANSQLAAYRKDWNAHPCFSALEITQGSVVPQLKFTMPSIEGLESSESWKNFSDIFVEDGNYLRAQNITLGYDFKSLFPKMPHSGTVLVTILPVLILFTKKVNLTPLSVSTRMNGRLQ